MLSPREAIAKIMKEGKFLSESQGFRQSFLGASSKSLFYVHEAKKVISDTSSSFPDALLLVDSSVIYIFDTTANDLCIQAHESYQSEIDSYEIIDWKWSRI